MTPKICIEYVKSVNALAKLLVNYFSNIFVLAPECLDIVLET